MSEGKTRVGFTAPASLVERADAVAELLGTSRTSLLIDALREELDAIVSDEEFQRRLRSAYYNGQIEFQTVESVLSTETALRMKLLRDSLDREPPEPAMEEDRAPRAEFYDDSLPEWLPDENAEQAADTDETT